MSFHAVSKYIQSSSWARTFLVTLVFLVLASSLFWLDYFRSYETEVAVLFVTKENQPAPVVASAMSSIMKTWTFATRAEKDSAGTSLLPETESKDVQKSTWNQNLTVVTQKESGVLIFSQRGENAGEAHEKALATLKTLMVATNLYYDKEHEVELRIIDKPITTLTVSNWGVYGLTVLATAIALTSIFFGVLTLVANKKQKNIISNVDNHIGESVSWIDPRKFVAVRPEALTFQEAEAVEEKGETGEEIVAEKATPVPSRAATRVAHAPGNLPIMSGALPQFGIEEVDLVTEESIPETTEKTPGEEGTFDVTAEPTVEEYKRRLNELLKGNSLT